MSCYAAVLKSISGLAFFQVANGAIDLVKHCLMYFCERKLRCNSLFFVVIKIVLSMVLYMSLGLSLVYLSNHATEAQ
ncbi:viral membrane associated early morphogenesis protein [Western grey kangaroopox virus]|uniref:Viral membrane associated early morphogenesis protein n=2 Tax=Macropopoxvirus TaxID=2733295 RepID=A0A2C9DT76_9POXV|nr:viral membrane associated early morphogenesis protein [Western grey kangaroopox virus]YP_010085399.1 viral membrane associated early morphogenesis protein [Eastern grey kangaroopox virus]ATI21045.1 viral membrane associated early morphogenesis protein [Western grey kangaroopox virus]ATI21209.1 viral membrane associated early morphogenesis protein [Eastern grey kangaroopox virus]ATX75116.1 viral membrane associated early morphogenesis protein [Eastern grey kangaroopox virus]